MVNSPNLGRLARDKHKARQLLQQNRLAEAKALFEKICERDNSDEESWFLLGAISGQLGAFDTASRCFRRVIALRPSAEAWDNLGLALQKQGQLDDAAASYRRAVELKPNFARAHSNLGALYWQRGELDAAISSLRRAIELEPRDAATVFNLGAALQAKSRHADALPCFLAAQRLDPARVEVYYQIGLTFWRLNELDKAAGAFQQAVEKQPAYTDAWRGLGEVLLQMQRYPQALSCYRRALDVFPKDSELLTTAGHLYRYFGQLNEAEVLLRRALEAEPGFVKARVVLGEVLVTAGRFDEAAECLAEALRLNPEKVEVVVALAQMYERRLDDARCYETLRTLLEKGVESATLGTIYCTLSPRIKQQREAIEYGERVQARCSDPLPEQKQLHAALGKAYESLALYDDAFKHFRRANELIQQQYDPDDFTRFVDRTIAAFSGSFLAAAPRARVSSNRPVFIIGMPRSGTSLVEQVLASHPLVYGAGELQDIGEISKELPSSLGTDPTSTDWTTRLTQEHLDAAALRYLSRLAEFSRDALRVTDKLPHNFLHVGLIELLFPAARIIHCVRDPVDTCLSCYFQDFGGQHLYSARLPWLGRHYSDYLRLMEHWKAVITLPILEMPYEQLIADPEAGIRRLVEFCGVPWDERCLRFHEFDRPVTTQSYDQARRPIYRSSAGKWRRYAAHLGELFEALGHDPSDL
jgi:tetratricopeptide (TPR) repeat protein